MSYIQGIAGSFRDGGFQGGERGQLQQQIHTDKIRRRQEYAHSSFVYRFMFSSAEEESDGQTSALLDGLEDTLSNGT